MRLTKSTVILVVFAHQCMAAIKIVTPWTSSTWNSGGNGNITWMSDPSDKGLKCEIQLLSGDPESARLIAHITEPNSPIPCDANLFQTHPLNDFASGKYWIRIGQSESDTWVYSGRFDFQGKGSTKPLVASSGEQVPKIVVPASNADYHNRKKYSTSSTLRTEATLAPKILSHKQKVNGSFGSASMLRHGFSWSVGAALTLGFLLHHSFW